MEEHGRYGGWQEQSGAQGVRAYMFFLLVHGFPFGQWFSFRFKVFLEVYGFPLS